MAFEYLRAALKRFSLVHIPTLALLIGLPIFWVELYVVRLPQGHSSWLAWGIFIILAASVFLGQYSNINRWLADQGRAWRDRSSLQRIFITGIALLAVAYLVIGCYAALLPVHLIQEHDALNYHITIPRQHLITNSFAHIPWSVTDLFLLPLDFALSPFWLVTPWPNKLIQFVFFLGALGNVYQLTYLWGARSRLRSSMAVLAVMACHAIAIQVGTAMLDIVMLYCFLACLHSLWTGRVLLAGIELAFFIWSKAFIAPQMVVIGIVISIICLLCAKKYVLIEIPVLRRDQWRVFLFTFLTSSLIIASPFLIKSFYYTGTPIFPFGVGITSPIVFYDPVHWQSIVDKANACLSMKDAYGNGRSLLDFIQHWWLLAVPEKGVNNAFDYPVGLVYLLVLGHFCIHFFKTFRSKAIPLLSLLILIWWVTWWFGSQQARFLLIPICLMIILTIVTLPKLSHIFIGLIVMCLGVETISLINAHRADWGKSASDIVRVEDKQLMDACQGTGMITWDKADVAYAVCAVNVVGQDRYFVIPKHGE